MNMKLPFSKVIIFMLVVGIIVCLIYIGSAKLDNREASLMSIILSFLSIIASYLISQHFAEEGHKEAIEEVKQQSRENLRTYALNAAEKVDNLSKELNRLSIFLEDEINSEYENPSEGMRSRTERLESTVHIINTLKSMNDTSLSDWRGVIPEELEEKDEEQLENAAVLSDLVTKIDDLTERQYVPYSEHIDERYLQKEIHDLKDQVIQVSRRIDGTRIRPKNISAKPKKEPVQLPCPYCNSVISYVQRPSKNSYKAVACISCKEKSTSRWYEDNGFKLEKNIPVEENISCPFCEQIFVESIGTLIQASKQVVCPVCQARLKATRNMNGISIKSISGPPVKTEDTTIIDENIIEQVAEALPPQPWPKGIHIEVSKKVGISNKVFNKCIEELIKKGRVHPQVDGILYYPQKEVE
ncbi:MAG: hypothetical protein ACYC3B_04640 [Sedimentisphaerales bacterium]